MGNRPDGLIMSQARDRAAIDSLEDTSFGPGRGVGRLVENAPHEGRPLPNIEAKARLREWSDNSEASATGSTAGSTTTQSSTGEVIFDPVASTGLISLRVKRMRKQ